MTQINLVSFDLLTVPRGLLVLVIEALFCIKSKESLIIEEYVFALSHMFFHDKV